MNDLDRLFNQLVHVLATEYPDRLTTPFHISELYQSILPYRKFKKQMGFECSEDYEMALLRLVAGESEYASLEPDEAQKQLMLEARAVHPNPGAFRDFAAARIKLNDKAVRRAQGASRAYAPPPAPPAREEETDSDPWAQFAPPEEPPAQTGDEAPAFEVVSEALAAAPEPEPPPEPPVQEVPIEPDDMEVSLEGRICSSCGEALPTNRPVVYCPFCGCRVSPIACPECGDEIEAGWRFCATCGRSASNN